MTFVFLDIVNASYLKAIDDREWLTTTVNNMRTESRVRSQLLRGSDALSCRHLLHYYSAAENVSSYSSMRCVDMQLPYTYWHVEVVYVAAVRLGSHLDNFEYRWLPSTWDTCGVYKALHLTDDAQKHGVYRNKQKIFWKLGDVDVKASISVSSRPNMCPLRSTFYE